jgi:hypothetical protein
MQDNKTDSLLSFVANLTGNQYLKIEEDLGQGFVRLNISEAERRQAKHDIQSMEDIVLEMLRNSRDAGAKRIFIASTKEENAIRKVTIADDGYGIPAELHALIFEPRVTSKLENIITDRYGIHGRGMALFAIRQVADDIDLVFSAPGRGTVLRVQTSTGLLNERKDQSTYPTIKYRRGEPIIIRGPHNIIRTALEFNFDHQNLEVFLGSPTEILATMYRLSADNEKDTSGEKSRDFKVWCCVGSVKSAAILADVAERRLGLKISVRNAQRIMSGKIEPLLPMIESLAGQNKGDEPEKKKFDLSKSEPIAKRISREDLDRLASVTAGEIEVIGNKYFIELSEKPDVQTEKDCIKISLRLKTKGN